MYYVRGWARAVPQAYVYVYVCVCMYVGKCICTYVLCAWMSSSSALGTCVCVCMCKKIFFKYIYDVITSEEKKKTLFLTTSKCLRHAWMIRMHIYIHVTYMYIIHTCYILIKPPLPYITSSRCKRLHNFRPVEILLHERGDPP